MLQAIETNSKHVECLLKWVKNLHTSVQSISITLKIVYATVMCLILFISFSDIFPVWEVSGRPAGFVPSCKDGCNRHPITAGPGVDACPGVETQCIFGTHLDVSVCQCVRN